MSLSIQAPNLATPVFFRLLNWTASAISRHRARRIESEAVKQLRRLDPHLLHDLDLDGEALWQPHPEIRMLKTPYLVSTGSDIFPKDDDRRLMV